MTPRLQLIGKAECHLCEQAHALLAALELDCTMVDIDDDLDLAVRYGLRIPVLRRPADGVELDWPFTADTVRAWADAARS